MDRDLEPVSLFSSLSRVIPWNFVFVKETCWKVCIFSHRIIVGTSEFFFELWSEELFFVIVIFISGLQKWFASSNGERSPISTTVPATLFLFWQQYKLMILVVDDFHSFPYQISYCQNHMQDIQLNQLESWKFLQFLLKMFQFRLELWMKS